MNEQLAFIDSRSAAVRVVLVIVVLAVLTGAFYGARWQFGRALAETFVPNSENSAQNALLAVALAPNDPQAHAVAAKIPKGGFFSENLAAAEKDYSQAVLHAPNEYRHWLDLGRTREQRGDAAGGETALRQAVRLAPNYAYPRWMLGNLLLREDKREEAFAEFKRAAETHSTLRQQVFYLLWETSGGNADFLKQAFGDTPQVRAALAVFYSGKNLPNESVQMWQSLSAEEKSEHSNAGENALRGNYEKLNFAAAQVFVRDLGRENAEPNKITNAGFEEPFKKPEETFFNWSVQQIKSLAIELDPAKAREGKVSLKMKFSGFSEPTLQTVPQFVAVEPNSKYRLTFALRTSELKSAGTPVLEIANATDLKPLGASKPFAPGSSDWQNVSVEFTAPPDAKGVLVRTTRVFCGANCPIVGVVWYDDFRLEKIGQK